MEENDSYPSTSHKKLIELSATGSVAPPKQFVSVRLLAASTPGSQPRQVIARQDAKWAWLGITHLQPALVEGCLTANWVRLTGTGSHVCNDYKENSRNFCYHVPSVQWSPTTVFPSNSLCHISLTIKMEWWPML